jgi:hypothetical protein
VNDGAAITELEKLLDALPDDEARKRVLEWARAKYERKAAPALLAPKAEPLKWGKMPKDHPLTQLPPVAPYVISNAPRTCAFDGLPPGVYGLVCTCPKCSLQCSITYYGVANNAGCAPNMPYVFPPPSAGAAAITGGYTFWNSTAGCAPVVPTSILTFH